MLRREDQEAEEQARREAEAKAKKVRGLRGLLYLFVFEVNACVVIESEGAQFER